LKILQATEYILPDAERSIERFVYELSRVLAGTGQSVTMLAGGQGRDLTLGGVRIEHASACVGSTARRAGPPCDRRIASVNSGTLAMHRQRPDVVHAHHFGSGYAASLLKKRDGIPYVLTIHRVQPAGEAEHLYREMCRKALDGASAVIAVSNSVKDWLEKDFGVPSTVIPLSVDGEKQGWHAAIRQYMGLYERALNA